MTAYLDSFSKSTIALIVYLHTLQLYVAPWHKGFPACLGLLQDRTLPYWNLCVCHFFNKTFPNRWIEGDEPIPWALHCLNIILLDFFLWGYVKYEIYCTLVDNVHTETVRIAEARESVTTEMLQNTWQKIECYSNYK